MTTAEEQKKVNNTLCQIKSQNKQQWKEDATFRNIYLFIYLPFKWLNWNHVDCRCRLECLSYVLNYCGTRSFKQNKSNLDKVFIRKIFLYTHTRVLLWVPSKSTFVLSFVLYCVSSFLSNWCLVEFQILIGL